MKTNKRNQLCNVEKAELVRANYVRSLCFLADIEVGICCLRALKICG